MPRRANTKIRLTAVSGIYFNLKANIMNGRKARALRKQAALTASTIDTDYQTEERIDYHGRKRIALSNPRVLDKDCHRAVYQQLKKT